MRKPALEAAKELAIELKKRAPFDLELGPEFVPQDKTYAEQPKE